MAEMILEVKNLKKKFYKKGISFTALDDVSFSLREGEILGIVGESGSGKSTIVRIITCLEEADEGSVWFEGKSISELKGKELRKWYQKISMVFQMPQDSFDPRYTLGDGIMEGMRNRGMKRRDAIRRTAQLLEMVELPSEFARRYPNTVSGGQCQRAAIARALATDPKLLICDEVTSALDVTVQQQILSLLKKLQVEMKLSFIIISHDLALVQRLCDRVLVMYEGKIVEQGTPDEIIMHPQEEYTKLLVDSVF